MKFTIIIGCILVAIAAFSYTDASRKSRKLNAELTWSVCTKDEVTSHFEQTSNHDNNLAEKVLTKCKREYDSIAVHCAGEMICRVAAPEFTLTRIRNIQEDLIEIRERTRKQSRMAQMVEDLKKDGISREDLKSFFRDEILQDEAADQDAEHEANAGRERTGRGW